MQQPHYPEGQSPPNITAIPFPRRDTARSGRILILYVLGRSPAQIFFTPWAPNRRPQSFLISRSGWLLLLHHQAPILVTASLFLFKPANKRSTSFSLLTFTVCIQSPNRLLESKRVYTLQCTLQKPIDHYRR